MWHGWVVPAADDTRRPLGHASGGQWPPSQRGGFESGMQLASGESVSRWGEALLAVDTARIGDTRALGLDEHLMWRWGRFRTKAWATGIVDVGRGQLLDIVRSRTANAPTKWLLERPRAWRCAISWAVLASRGLIGPRSTRQTRRVRVHQLRQLPNPSPPLRRETQLGAARHPHSTLKHEAPVYAYPSGCHRFETQR